MTQLMVKLIIMAKEVKIFVNEKDVPLNQFVTSITEKLVLAIVDSLKGIEEEVKDVKIKVKL